MSSYDIILFEIGVFAVVVCRPHRNTHEAIIFIPVYCHYWFFSLSRRPPTVGRDDCYPPRPDGFRQHRQQQRRRQQRSSGNRPGCRSRVRHTLTSAHSARARFNLLPPPRSPRVRSLYDLRVTRSIRTHAKSKRTPQPPPSVIIIIWSRLPVRGRARLCRGDVIVTGAHVRLIYVAYGRAYSNWRTWRMCNNTVIT